MLLFSIKKGIYYGNDKDILDGYIHMCGELNQLPRLVNKYYIGKLYYVYELKFSGNDLVNNIKFELSNNITHPHLYNRPLLYSDVVSQSEFK